MMTFTSINGYFFFQTETVVLKFSKKPKNERRSDDNEVNRTHTFEVKMM